MLQFLRILFLFAIWVAKSTTAQVLSQERPLGYGVTANLTHDSNYNRAPASQEQSATGLDTRLFARYSDQISRQKVALNAEAGLQHYFTRSSLNAGIYRLNGRWDWEYGPVWFGALDAGALRQPNNASDQLISVRNIVSTNSLALDLGYRFDVRWALIGGLGYSDVGNSSNLLRGADAQTASTTLALRYQPGTAWDARIGVQHASVNRENQRFDAFGNPLSLSINNDSKETRLFFGGSWAYSDTSKLIGNVAYVKRDYDLSQQRNFSGLAWSLQYAYSPFRNWSANIQFSRDISNENFVFSSHTVSNALLLSGRWQATGKIAVSPLASITRRSYTGDSANVGSSLGSTSVIRYGLRADYELFPSVSVVSSLINETRSGAGSIWSYRNTSFTLGGSFKQ